MLCYDDIGSEPVEGGSVQNEYGQLRRNITSAPGFILYGAPRLLSRVIVVKKWRR
jgi:hypothetical protein